jgi:hypothetical protein
LGGPPDIIIVGNNYSSISRPWNRLTENSTGNYTVFLPGFTKEGGQLQVIGRYVFNKDTPIPVRCNTQDWHTDAAGTLVDLACVDKSSAPINDYLYLAYSYGLTLAHYGIGGPFHGAYTFANQPTQTNRYYAGNHYQYNEFGTGPLAIQRTGTGLYTVTVPGTLSYTKSIAFVSAVGPASTWCNVASLVGATVNVACYAQGGVPTDSKFTLTFQTASS